MPHAEMKYEQAEFHADMMSWRNIVTYEFMEDGVKIYNIFFLNFLQL